MPTEEFVMRGSTASGTQEVLNFGSKHGYAFKLIEFSIYPSTNIGGEHYELAATVTADKTYEDPQNPDFSNEGLIASALLVSQSGIEFYGGTGIVNDTFLITQNLILAAVDAVAGSPMAVNWQCKFKPVKMSEAEMANANLRQFHIYD